jgi:hypothetical protein
LVVTERIIQDEQAQYNFIVRDVQTLDFPLEWLYVSITIKLSVIYRRWWLVCWLPDQLPDGVVVGFSLLEGCQL